MVSVNAYFDIKQICLINNISNDRNKNNTKHTFDKFIRIGCIQCVLLSLKLF